MVLSSRARMYSSFFRDMMVHNVGDNFSVKIYNSRSKFFSSPLYSETKHFQSYSEDFFHSVYPQAPQADLSPCSARKMPSPHLGQDLFFLISLSSFSSYFWYLDKSIQPLYLFLLFFSVSFQMFQFYSSISYLLFSVFVGPQVPF